MIHIEINEGYGGEGHYSIRIGDIRGSTELSNITKEELINEIKEELKNLTKHNSQKNQSAQKILETPYYKNHPNSKYSKKLKKELENLTKHNNNLKKVCPKCDKILTYKMSDSGMYGCLNILCNWQGKPISKS